MHVKMKTKTSRSQVILSIIALSLLTTQHHVYSAPTDPATSASNSNSSFYSKLYENSSSQRCQLLPKFVNDANNDSFISLKINSMCNNNSNVNASSTFPSQESSTNSSMCSALSSLFPALCEVSANTSTNGTKLDTIVSTEETVSTDLEKICKRLTAAVKRVGKRNKSLLLLWRDPKTPKTKYKCRADCKNNPIPGVLDDKKHYVNPVCMLLLRGYELYLETSKPPELESNTSQVQSESESTTIAPIDKNNNAMVQDQDNTKETGMETIPRKAKKNVPFDRTSLKSSSFALTTNTENQPNKTEDQDGQQSQNQTDQGNALAPVEQTNVAETGNSNQPNANSSLGLRKTPFRTKGREGVTESSDTSLFGNGTNEKPVVESPKNQSVDGSLQPIEKPNQALSNSLPSDKAANKTSPEDVRVSDQMGDGISKSKSKSTTTSTAASVDAGNGPSDLPLPLPPSKDDDEGKKKTSTTAPGNTNDDAQSKVGGLQKDSESSPVFAKPIQPESSPQKANSLNNEDIDKKDQIQKPISNKNTDSDKGDGDTDTDLGEEVDDDYNDDGQEKKVDKNKRPTGKKNDDNDNDNEDFGYRTSAKTASKGRNRFGDGDALQFEDHGTTINVSLNESEESGFFSYFMFSVIVFGVLYLVVHNKKKLLAYVVEGRRPRSRTRRTSSSSSQYRRLENNFD